MAGAPQGSAGGPGRFLPSSIRNKHKREAVTAKLRAEKQKAKKQKRVKRKQEDEKALALGEEPPPRQAPRTIENTREVDETLARPDDEELHADDAEDELSAHFRGEHSPKVLITTSHNPSKVLYRFISELLTIIPGSTFYERGSYHVKQIIKYATNREFTAVIVVHENQKRPNSLLLVALPGGPTAHFRLTNLVLSKSIKGHGRSTKHRPEIILNNFTTRLGHRVGRLLASLFPQDPQFRGRRVVTFHNQRDFLFFRHHRYIFETRDAGKKDKKVAKGAGGEEPKEVIARLQECGPRFTLKLKSLQRGTFDSKTGEYEWVHKADMDTSRRRFFL
eukprot:TRINITY_DN22799_c0_g1_i1.p1 TRINITY_DN22799_c0_g1~~TRINITY_DN22799_c0_g1_i1.p1  ORF type:complete len:334 (+),score=58.43 TRINITY_DN22799_c0_g1_i1:254-1255(+)